MLEAIHKSTKERISAFKVGRNLEWQGREREDFIAPTEYIENWTNLRLEGIEEVKVSFVKTHKRYEGTDKEEIVREHFRIETEKAIESNIAESEEHKLAKKYIYDNLEKIQIVNFENKTIFQLGEVEDIFIEKGLSNKKRADVLIKFKTWNPVFGRGICFEIQISPQDKYETTDRSYDRASQGYSIIWIWSKDLTNFKDKVILDTFQEAIKNYLFEVKSQQNEDFNEIAKKVKLFTIDQREIILKEIKRNEILMEHLSKINETTISSVRKEFDSSLQQLKEKIFKDKEEIQNNWDFEIASAKDTIHHKIELLIKEMSTSVVIEKKIEDYLNEIKSKLDLTTSRDRFSCSYCGSKDTHEYMDCYVCFNCKKRSYKDGRQS